MPKAPHVRLADEALCDRPGRRRRESYLRRRQDHRGRARRRTPTRSIRATASCPRTPNSLEACADGRHRLHRPAAGGDPRHGPQGRAPRRLMEKAGVPVVPGYHGARQEPDFLRAEGLRDRLSRADQGDRGRRRQGHAARRPAAGFRRRARLRAARGDERLRRSARADREIRRPRRATSRCRSSPTRTAMSSISSSATARCSAATRR